MKTSESLFLDVRGLRYHCRCWGAHDAPKLFLLHGWMDVSASFQFLVDAFAREWRVIAPDWRGYGLTAWSGVDSYWIPDYFADLDRLLAHFQPDAPVNLIGHSMGGNVACLYAGVRPQRVANLINLEGFGMAATRPNDAPLRYARWLDELVEPQRFRDYASFDELAERLMGGNARLTRERALFLARHWGHEAPSGRVELRSDPAHKRVNPVQYQLEEAKACWRRVGARVLWVDGDASETRTRLRIDDAEHAARKACFGNLVAHTIAGAGHMLHHDQPEALARVIEAFLPRG